MRAGCSGGIDPSYLPGYTPAKRSDLNLGLNAVSIWLGLQPIGSLVAAATVVGQFYNEINKVSVVAAPPVELCADPCSRALFIGLAILRGQASMSISVRHGSRRSLLGLSQWS